MRRRRRFRPSFAFLLLLGIVVPGTGIPGPAGGQQPPADHVVLVSIDGFRPDFYRDRSWPAPVLRGMAREGARAEGVRGVFPTVTYPSHTTIVTGVRPARHGIYYNEPFEPEGPTGRWYWEADSVRVPTLWDAVAEAGGTTAAFGWPVTVGAAIDRNLPEVWPPGAYEERIHAVRRHATPRGFLEELEREATGRLVVWSREGPSTEFQQAWWDDRSGEMAAYTLARYRPTLLALHLLAVDAVQHDRGREHPEVREAVAAADRVVGRLVAAARRAGILDRTAFVVVGDHGFVDLNTALAPDVWLAEAGLLEERAVGGDWRAAFHVAGGSAFLHLADPGDRAALERVREVLEALPPGIRGLFRILEGDEVERLAADPRSPLALAARRGTYFVRGSGGPAVRPRTGGGHGFLPGEDSDILTGFVAWGAGVRPGSMAPEMELVDVAPLVAALLGVELKGVDGVVREGLLVR